MSAPKSSLSVGSIIAESRPWVWRLRGRSGLRVSSLEGRRIRWSGRRSYGGRRGRHPFSVHPFRLCGTLLARGAGMSTDPANEQTAACSKKGI
ncbi:MAG: hypothetical protein ABSB40_13035, partial [Nitrososphaeria archaeon]